MTLRPLLLLLLPACTGIIGDQDPIEKDDSATLDTATEGDADTDTDSDADSDADTDTDADTDSDADSDSDTDTDLCWGVAFETTPTVWTLPTAPVTTAAPWASWSLATYDQTCADGSHPSDADWYRSTLDLTGDGRPDLVIHKDTCTDRDVGTTHWAVYANTGTGYATTPVDWALPAAGVDWTNPWYQPSQRAYGNTCADGSHPGSADWYYQLLDLSGDGRPDLVVTEDTCTDATAGVDHWNVYLNDGTGFVSPPVAWSLPAPPVDWGDPWYDPEIDVSGSTCADGTLRGQVYWAHTLSDLTGDGAPDLVVTRDSCTDAAIGRDRWDVYRNTGAGFAPAPIVWTLPTATIAGDAPWARTADTTEAATCADGSLSGAAAVSHATLDLTGDGAPDLVRTRDACADAAIGASRWEVHVNTGAGFEATPLGWALPAATTDEAAPWGQATATRDTSTCLDGSQPGAARHVHTTEDLTGDGAPELVLTADSCGDPDVGVDHWAVYRNEGLGFASSPLDWTVPLAPVTDLVPWSATSGDHLEASCDDGSQPYAATLRWSTRDLDGDLYPDLVSTQSSCDDAAVGTTVWWVYRGLCR